MKKLAIIAAALLVTVSAFAQGTVNFRNRVGVDAPVYNVGGTTLLDGPTFKAELLVGTSAGNMVSVGVTDFRAGAGAGYFLGGTLTLDAFAPGSQVVAQVRAWDSSTGATFDAAGIKGTSGLLNLTLGNQVIGGAPPTFPTELVGLQSFSLVPEPSTMALALLGGLALLFRRRK